jgi:hypothetical protein
MCVSAAVTAKESQMGNGSSYKFIEKKKEIEK